VALHNAERYGEQVENVRVLTAALLPEGVPTVDGLRFAARYAPASQRGEHPAVGIERLGRLIRDLGGATEDDIADALIVGRNHTEDACVSVLGR
jgi:hypothetical protein